MNKLFATRERFLRDRVPVRLGGIASNLARIRSFSEDPSLGDAMKGVLLQTGLFIDWVAPDLDPEHQALLLDLQRLIARCRARWEKLWPDPIARAALGREASQWSDRILALSGLANDDSQEDARRQASAG